MLQESFLGKLYTVWTGSFVFMLLQRAYCALLRAVRGSVILRALFAEGAAENAWRASLACRMLRGVFALAQKVLGAVSGLAAAAEESRLLRAARRSVILDHLLHFEGLLGLFLFVMFIVPHNYWNNLWFVLAAFVFLAFYLFLAAVGRRNYAAPDMLGLGAILFLLALVLSLGFSADVADSVRILLFFLASFAVCYVIAADFRAPEKLRRLLAFLYAALLLTSFYGVIQHAFDLVEVSASFTDLELNAGVPGRVTSTMNNPNNFSDFILLFLPLGAAFAAGAKKPLCRAVLAAGLVLPALALLFTYSRSGWIGVVVAAAVFTFCCNKRLIPALFVVGLLAVPFLPESVMIRLSTIGNAADSSTSHRFDIWRGVLRLLGDHDRFLTGIGLGPEAFRRVYPFYSVGSAKIGAYHTQQHYLELLVETGLLGFLSFFYMMCKYFGRAVTALRRSAREKRLIIIACISSIFALAFIGLVEYIWFYQRIMFAFFIFLGILLAAAQCGADTE